MYPCAIIVRLGWGSPELSNLDILGAAVPVALFYLLLLADLGDRHIAVDDLEPGVAQ